MQHAQNSHSALQHIVQARILQIRQKWCTISTSKARASERQLKRKNTRAPCRIRREGITCRGVVPFVFRRRRDVLFFSFFLKKRDGAVAVSFFCFSGIRLAPYTHCRQLSSPQLTAAANGHGGQRAGRPTCDPGKAAPLRGVGDATPYNHCRKPSAVSRFPVFSCLFVLTFFFTFPGKYATI